MSSKQPVLVTRDIAATPEKIWEMVTDLPRMGEWSPENNGGTWSKGATGPALGASFRGRNTNGKKVWSTSVKVNACEAPSRFSFGLIVGGKNWCDWVYEIEPIPTGVRVTHSWVDHRSKLASTLGKLISGVADREAHNKANMEVTMDNLAKAAQTA